MNKLEFTGKIEWVGKRLDGVSKSTGKPWSMIQVMIAEEAEQYPQKVCATIFGEDRIASMMLTVGEVVTAHLSIDARSFTDKNGVVRGSTEVRIWKLDRPSEESKPTPTQPSTPAAVEEDSGLPF